MIKNENYPLYIVCWEDHSSDGGWVSLEDIKKAKPILCHSIGYLVEEDSKMVKLIDTYTDDKGLGGLNIILKSCITEMYEINIE
jgi:hypothetical protein